MKFNERTVQLARDLEAKAKEIENERYAHLTRQEIERTRPCLQANLHRNFADRLRLLAGRMKI